MLAGKGTAAVAGVGQGAAGHLQGQELQGLDRGERGRRHAEGDGIKDDIVDKGAPAGIAAVLGLRVRVIVAVPVPAAGRDLGDRVPAGQDVLPVLGNGTGPRQDPGHADDRDVDGPGVAASRPLAGMAADKGLQAPVTALDHLPVHIGHRCHLPVQGGELADHEDTLAVLLLAVDPDQGLCPIPCPPAVNSFGGQAQLAQVEQLQPVADLLPGKTLAAQLGPLPEELGGKGRAHAAAGMTRSGLQEHGLLAGQHLPAVLLVQGAGTDDLLGEKVDTAQLQADPDAGPVQVRGHGRDHGRGQAVVDATGKEDMQLPRRPGVCPEEVEEHTDHLLPEHERGKGRHVAAGLAALEDETAGAGPQEHPQKAGGGYMEVGGNALLFQEPGLFRATAGDEGKGRPVAEHHLHLRPVPVRGQEAEQPQAPWSLAETAGRGSEHGLQLARLEHGRGQEGQATRLGHGQGKIGRITDPGHGALDDGIAGAVRGGQGSVPAEDIAGGEEGRQPVDVITDRGHDATHGHEPLRQAGGQADVLAKQPDTIPAVCRHGRCQARHDVFLKERVIRAVRDQQFQFPDQGLGSTAVDTAGDPYPATPGQLQAPGLGAVEGGEHPAHLVGQGRFPGQGALAVQDHAGSAGRHAGGGSMRPDAALDVDRQGSGGKDALEQDK